jgi:heterodisulfide reductase subunit C
MTDFGFGIHEYLMIDSDKTSDLYNLLLLNVPSVAACMSCGSCTGTCNAAVHSGYGFRKIVSCLQNNIYDKIRSSLEVCQFCSKCGLVCPRGVNTRKAMLVLKKNFIVMK